MASKETGPDLDIILISSDSEPEGDRGPFVNGFKETTAIKTESVEKSFEEQGETEGDPPETGAAPDPQNPGNSLAFDAFALFSPENASLPIEERLSSFINNVQSLTDEKAKLQEAERQAIRERDRTKTELQSAHLEISVLKGRLGEKESTIGQQSSSLRELTGLVGKLKREGSGSKRVLRDVTSKLEGLQAKLAKVIQESEVDVPTAVFSAEEPEKGTAVNLGAGPQNAATLKQIEKFERDFDAQFSKLEEGDKQITEDIGRTNALLQQLQERLCQQFGVAPATFPPVPSVEEEEEEGTQFVQEIFEEEEDGMGEEPRAGCSYST